VELFIPLLDFTHGFAEIEKEYDGFMENEEINEV